MVTYAGSQSGPKRIAFSRAGENIAQVTHDSDPALFAHDLLINGQRHRANNLDPDFHDVGIGVARTGETFWITQVFIAPRRFCRHDPGEVIG